MNILEIERLGGDEWKAWCNEIDGLNDWVTLEVQFEAILGGIFYEQIILDPGEGIRDIDLTDKLLGESMQDLTNGLWKYFEEEEDQRKIDEAM